MKEVIGFFSGSCLLMIVAMVVNIAFWGSLIWLLIWAIGKYLL